MSKKITQTDNFTEAIEQQEFEFESDDLELALDEEGELTLDLGFSIDDDVSDSGLGFDLSADLGNLDFDLGSIIEDPVEVMHKIYANNEGYDGYVVDTSVRTSAAYKVFVSHILDSLKSVPDNNRLMQNKLKEVRNDILGLVPETLANVKQGKGSTNLILGYIVTRGFKCNDLMHRLIGSAVGDLISTLAMIESDKSKIEAINSSGDTARLSDEELQGCKLMYLTQMYFDPSIPRQEIVCPSCGEKHVHDIIKSTKTVERVLQSKHYLRHDPLICPNCGTFVILPLTSFDICAEYVKNRCEEISSEARDIESVAIDSEMMVRVPEAFVARTEVKNEITEEEQQEFINTQKTYKLSMDRNFYSKFLTNRTHAERIQAIYDNTIFNRVSIPEGVSIDRVVAGALFYSGYFEPLKSLNEKKRVVVSKLMLLGQCKKFLEQIYNPDATRNEDILLSTGIYGLRDALSQLKLEVTGVETIDASNIASIAPNLSKKITEYTEEFLAKYDHLDSDIRNYVAYLKANSYTLFRFLKPSVGNLDDYYSLFTQASDGEELLTIAYKSMARHAWDDVIVAKFISEFSVRSRSHSEAKYGITDLTYYQDKIMPIQLRNVSLVSDDYALQDYRYVISIPSEYTRLVQSFFTKDYATFYYNVLLLRGMTLKSNSSAETLRGIINIVDVPECCVQAFNSVSDSPNITTFLDLLEESDNVKDSNRFDMYENKEFVCTLNMVRYASLFLNDTQNITHAEGFLTTCMNYVDKIYNCYNEVYLAEFVMDFISLDDVWTPRASEQITYDYKYGSELLHDSYNSDTHLSASLYDIAMERNEGEDLTLGTEQGDIFKIVLKELPTNFRHRDAMALYLLSYFKTRDESYNDVLELLDDKYLSTMDLYLSALSNVKYSLPTLCDLGLEKEMLQKYSSDFYKYVERIKEDMSPNLRSSFTLALQRLGL